MQIEETYFVWNVSKSLSFKIIAPDINNLLHRVKSNKQPYCLLGLLLVSGFKFNFSKLLQYLFIAFLKSTKPPATPEVKNLVALAGL